MFGVGHDSILRFRYPSENGVTSWTDLGGSVKQIAVGNDGQGQLSVFGIGSADNSTIYYKYQLSPGGNWSEWTNLGGSVKQIAVGNDGQGQLSVFGIGSADNSPYHIYQSSPGGNWSDWTKLGGTVKEIAVGNAQNDSLALFSSGLQNVGTYVKHQILPEGRWSEWIYLSGNPSDMAVGNDANGSLYVFTVLKGAKEVYYNQIENVPLPNPKEKDIRIVKVSDGINSWPYILISGMDFLDENNILLLQKNDGKVRLPIS